MRCKAAMCWCLSKLYVLKWEILREDRNSMPEQYGVSVWRRDVIFTAGCVFDDERTRSMNSS